MPLNAILLLGVLAAPLIGPDAAPAPAPAAVDEHDEGREQLPRLAFVAADELDAAALEAELVMRLPELQVIPFDNAIPTEPFIYIQARRETGKLHRVALIFSDGRAYYERLDVGEAGSPERVLASAIANLLFSIESGAVEPDQRGVEAPLGAVEEPAPPSEERPEQPEPEPEPAAPLPATPRLELGLGFGFGQATALGAPRFADQHLGLFAVVELALRTRRGLYAGLEFRPGGAMREGYRLTRLGAGLALGYAWRGAKLEVLLAASAAVVPWVVASDGRSEPVRALDDGSLGRPPLVRLGARVSPGYRVVVERGPVASLRIGPRVDLAGGFVASAPARVAGLQAPGGAELFRLGGLEIFAGLELNLWFRLASSPQRSM